MATDVKITIGNRKQEQMKKSIEQISREEDMKWQKIFGVTDMPKSPEDYYLKYSARSSLKERTWRNSLAEFLALLACLALGAGGVFLIIDAMAKAGSYVQ